MNKTKLYTVLTYAGTLPFIACAILPYANLPDLPLIDSFGRIAVSYALVIVSFMAGTHWGSYLIRQNESPVNLFLSSNVIAIIVWLVFLSTGTSITLWISITAFIFLLWIDYKLYQTNLITRHYLHVRRNATMIVVVSLLFTLAAL